MQYEYRIYCFFRDGIRNVSEEKIKKLAVMGLDKAFCG